MAQADYGDQLIICQHHWSDTLDNDWTNARRGFYGIVGTPHVQFDGVYGVTGAPGGCEGAAEDYIAVIEQRLSETGGISPVRIAGAMNVGEAMVSLWATFTLSEPGAVTSPRAFILILEDGVIAFDEAYDNVTRAAYEEDVFFGTPLEFVTVATDLPLDPSWNPDNLHAVAFLQEWEGDDEIYQTARLMGGASVGAQPIAALTSRIRNVAPNPVGLGRSGTGATIHLRLSDEAANVPVSLTLMDVTGRVVRQLAAGSMAAGPSSITWDGRDERGRTMGTGAYFLKLDTRDGTHSSRLVVLR